MSGKFEHLEIEGSTGPPTRQEIEAIESVLGVNLPRDFLDFLEIANGAYINGCIRIPPDDEELSFCQVYRTGKDESGNYNGETFIGEILMERQFKDTPKEVLPFVRDGSGSVVFLDLTEGGNGRIVAFVHGLPEWASRHQEDRYVELASEFVNYTDLLYKCEDLI